MLAHACRKLDVSLAMVMRWPRREFGTRDSGIKLFLEVAAEILGLNKAATDRTSKRQILIEVSEGHSFSATKATR
ncbi:MAG: hypothetical protein NTV94_05760 [Planctomycetota bacterium]|nr:hypothetical protein [Planctomycetota bacterium]